MKTLYLIVRFGALASLTGLIVAGTGCAYRERVVVRGYAPPPNGVVVVAHPVVTERVIVR
jgi:hypothetical protein